MQVKVETVEIEIKPVPRVPDFSEKKSVSSEKSVPVVPGNSDKKYTTVSGKISNEETAQLAQKINVSEKISLNDMAQAAQLAQDTGCAACATSPIYIPFNSCAPDARDIYNNINNNISRVARTRSAQEFDILRVYSGTRGTDSFPPFFSKLKSVCKFYPGWLRRHRMKQAAPLLRRWRDFDDDSARMGLAILYDRWINANWKILPPLLARKKGELAQEYLDRIYGNGDYASFSGEVLKRFGNLRAAQ